MVTPATIIAQAKIEGVNLVLSQGKIRAAGNDTALLKWKPIILENKAAIVDLLSQTQNDEAEEPATRVMDLDFSPVSVKIQDIGDWENLINWWLDHIEEQDPELRNTCLNQCRCDPEARRYFLSHAILEFRKSKRESND